MRSDDKSRKANFLIFGLATLVSSLFIRISPLLADFVQQVQDPAEGEARPWRPSGEDTEVIANLEFLESLEFLEEEVALVDDYEALDKGREQNEQ